MQQINIINDKKINFGFQHRSTSPRFPKEVQASELYTPLKIDDMRLIYGLFVLCMFVFEFLL